MPIRNRSQVEHLPFKAMRQIKIFVFFLLAVNFLHPRAVSAEVTGYWEGQVSVDNKIIEFSLNLFESKKKIGPMIVYFASQSHSIFTHGTFNHTRSSFHADLDPKVMQKILQRKPEKKLCSYELQVKWDHLVNTLSSKLIANELRKGSVTKPTICASSDVILEMNFERLGPFQGRVFDGELPMPVRARENEKTMWQMMFAQSKDDVLDYVGLTITKAPIGPIVNLIRGTLKKNQDRFEGIGPLVKKINGTNPSMKTLLKATWSETDFQGSVYEYDWDNGSFGPFIGEFSMHVNRVF